MKKLTALSMAAVILAMSLTACGSNDVKNIPDEQDASENAVSETPDEPGTCEDYIKLADIYLQTDDVIQALAVLDEGIEKLRTGGQDVAEQQIDLLSQRKEYILAGTVAIRTKYVENEYDEEGSVCYNKVSERDENGKIKYSYDESDGKSSSVKVQYDGDGNRIEYEYISYSNDEVSSSFRHTYAYDENGNEIEYVGYDKSGNLKEKQEYEYDANGNQIKEVIYDEDGEIKRWTEMEYDAAGNEIKFAEYIPDKCTFKKIKDYDEHRNIISYVMYNGDESIIMAKKEYEYDENDNEIKYVSYSDDMTINYCEERAYDENGKEIKYVIQTDGVITYWREHEYDENGNEIKDIRYDNAGSIVEMSEYEYNENDRRIYERYYNKNGVVIRTQENEYAKDGNIIREVQTYYSSDTGQKRHTKLCEYTYDEKGNLTKYDFTNYGEEETTSLRWEREYDEDGRKAAFYFYDNEQTASYQSKTEYDENGLEIEYTGCDENGTILVRKETEYDASGKVIKENYYDANDNLIWYYENEYDAFGSITRQTMYEGGVLKAERQTSYAYRYIGDIDTGAADDMDNDMTSEEMLIRFLNGQEKIRYRSREGNMKDGIIAEVTITDLINFKVCKEIKASLEYTFLDITGDGIEELIIRCNGNELYVIQCDYGILKVICHTWGNSDWDSKLIKLNGRIGVGCYSYVGNARKYTECHFFDGNGKKEISLRIDWDSENRASYSMYDSDSFKEHDISEGEYYDITEMITEMDIDWQKLEEPTL